MGVYNAPGLVVSDNVIHGTVEASIRAKGKGVTLEKNLVSFSMARACYQERAEDVNLFFHASIEVSFTIQVFQANS